MKLFKAFIFAILAAHTYIFILPAPLSNMKSYHEKEHREKPYGLRHKFDKGIGDRYYTGIPAYHYQHMWPEWKRKIWYTIGDWNNEEIPTWVAYYDYPYVVWPNFYRYFGSPYYTREQHEKRRLAKVKPKFKTRTDYDYANAAF